jgi:hypothetical protein
MTLRNLRIAWSIAWGAVAVYLVVLTARAFELKPLSQNPPSTVFGKPPLEWIEYSDDLEHESKLTISLKFWEFDMWIWETILPVAALAAVPWLPRRFSLRALIIATTLVAIALGAMAWLRSIAASNFF